MGSSERRTIFADRVGLIKLATEITNCYLDAETELLERRRQLATVTLPTTFLFTHEVRHILSSLDVTLRALKGNFAAEQTEVSSLSLFEAAEFQHAQLVDKINTFETNLRLPRAPDTLLTTRHLAIALSECFTQANFKNIAIVGQACDKIFWLKGPVSDLYQLLEPIVRNGFTALQTQSRPHNASDLSELFFADLEMHDYDFWIEPYELNESTEVLIGVAVLGSLKSTAHLQIRVKDAGIGISSEIVHLMKHTSAFSRLPSDRLDGGRGMLSVIAGIKAHYRATCNYYEVGTAWQIDLQVKLEVPPEQI